MSDDGGVGGPRPPFEWLYPYLLAGLAGACAANLLIIYYRPSMLPTKAPPSSPAAPDNNGSPPRTTYNPITARNIFNADGVIPPTLASLGKSGEKSTEGVAVKSQLPMKLIGTIVHINPKKSLATVELSGMNKIMTFSVDENMENLAQLVSVERKRITFRNTNNGQLEYIEMEDDNKINFGVANKPAGEVEETGRGEFTLKRSDLLKYTDNLTDILQQARAVPNVGPNGKVNGFRILDMAPGSIYEKLGIKRMDVIKTVNGELVDSPAKAMELYNTLKNSRTIRLNVEREGRDEQLSYNISD